MAKSDLTLMESSGVLRKIKTFSVLDKTTGIVDVLSVKISKSVQVGLDTFAAGGYNETFGLDIMNRIIGGGGVKAVSATRENGTAIFTVTITSVFDDRTVMINYPHGGYE